MRSISLAGAQGAGQLAAGLGELAEGTQTGDSIAVNGVCLTVTKLDRTQATFGISAETVGRSTLAQLRVGSRVNVERAMKATDRFGGHFVQGHVDGTGTIRAIRRTGDFAEVEFACGAQLLSHMVEKGSVAVDGISLTVAGLTGSSFSVAVIPETWNRTTLSERRVGDPVNIETDVIVKVIKRHLETLLGHNEALTIDKLKQMGF